MDFVDQLTAFRARTEDPGFSGLIILGTRQPITAALLIGALSVERVAFLLTDETRTMPNQVASLLGRSAEHWLCPAGDHSTTLRVYEGVKEVMETWAGLERSRIAVDVTGGLKPMSVGLEKAAHLLGLTTVYIESVWGPLADGKVGPLPGSQRLVIPPNPYTVFGDLEAAEARRLYAAHDYEGARRIFIDLAQRVPPPDNLALRACGVLARAYALWDSFDLPGAEAVLGQMDMRLLPPPLAEALPILEAQTAALHRMNAAGAHIGSRAGPSLPILREQPIVLALLGSLYSNARRREAQGRFDVAALLRYRCLELLSQHRLATYGLLTERPDFRDLLRRRPSLEADYRVVEDQVGFHPRGLPRPGKNGKIPPIALFGGYMLLAALDDPLVAGFAIEQIRARADARNKSILAHGYRLITHDEYGQFRSVVEEMIDRFFAAIGGDREAWLETFTFVPLDT